jgi:hypothetical protein
MPTSKYSQICSFLPVLFDFRSEIESVLDVGIGFGKYGLLAREYLDIWNGRYQADQWKVIIDGIEVFGGYRNPIYDYVYDTVYLEKAEHVARTLGKYDVIILVDVIEHLNKKEGVLLLDQLVNLTKKFLFVCHPDGKNKDALAQQEVFGNKHERHLARWLNKDFIKYPYRYSLSSTETFICSNEIDCARIKALWEPERRKSMGINEVYGSKKEPVNISNINNEIPTGKKARLAYVGQRVKYLRPYYVTRVKKKLRKIASILR